MLVCLAHVPALLPGLGRWQHLQGRCHLLTDCMRTFARQWWLWHPLLVLALLAELHLHLVFGVVQEHDRWVEPEKEEEEEEQSQERREPVAV